MDTISAKISELERNWFVADAEGKVLGRFASEVAKILRGKHKPIYTPHVDTGDHVVIINAEKIKVTGNKLEDKIYTRYSGYPGGLKKTPLERVLETRPTYVLEHAIKGMLPRNKLGRKMLKKVRIYAGADHPHESQTPEAIDLA
jgi:large subunit ribosomal protein L13